MMWLRQIIARRRFSSDLSEEIQQHLEEKVEELVAEGMPREQAIHYARREFGNVVRIEEQGREVWAWPWIENRLADLSFAFRQMRREPLFSIVSCLSLALGIGATTLMFSVVYSVLINPYPYKDADRIMHIHILDKDAFLTDLLLSSSQFQRFQDSRVLDGAIATGRSILQDSKLLLEGPSNSIGKTTLSSGFYPRGSRGGVATSTLPSRTRLTLIAPQWSLLESRQALASV